MFSTQPASSLGRVAPARPVPQREKSGEPPGTSPCENDAPTTPGYPRTRTRWLRPRPARRCHRHMQTEPLVNLTVYDVWDDDHCPCETCTTPWGTDLPDLLARPN